MFFTYNDLTLLLLIISMVPALASTIQATQTAAGVNQQSRAQYPDVPLPRDKSTATDALNILRCVQVNGYPNATQIGKEQDGILVFLPGIYEVFNTSYVRNVSACSTIYGFGVQVSIHSGSQFDDDVTFIGTLAELVADRTQITGLTRASYIVESDLGGTAVDSPYLQRRTSTYYYAYMADDAA
ncbi:hypothetical protein KAFR_0I02160 [Kazachstania africana CBS 2517]|uniref:Uncharacterized protein n=1 Tax=Kazachstania africana (strain ATCC 22294 / BCRC 22015 / CBS 2517 / CECT 1963 / NBRC 1671 / NRRL Y-8276) TaxID=1071382 RepID=H2B046_KAZAF|nr:hypothetical protein KAFR_0I02160 [Kazachstania africana CBS 2517]CCF59996.1 hypothetical protein KAFR_0I02160 [Kazachstania africana CBS 2517]